MAFSDNIDIRKAQSKAQKARPKPVNPANFGGVGRFAMIPKTSPAPPPAPAPYVPVQSPSPAPVAAVPAPAAAAPERKSMFDLNEIRDALAAISAQFGLQRGTLESERDAVGRAFQFMVQRLNEAREEAKEATTGLAAGRGLLRSGLFLERVGEIEEQAAQERAQATAERDAKVRAIARTISGMTGLEKAERVNAARQIAREQLVTEEELAKILELAGLSGAPGVPDGGALATGLPALANGITISANPTGVGQLPRTHPQFATDGSQRGTTTFQPGGGNRMKFGG